MSTYSSTAQTDKIPQPALNHTTPDQTEAGSDHNGDPRMLRTVLEYCKAYSHVALSPKHYLQYLKENGIHKVAETRVIAQLNFFVGEYFRDTVLYQSIPQTKEPRYHPYSAPKAPRRNKSKTSFSTSTPEHVDVKFNAGAGHIAVPQNQPVSIVMNYFSGAPASSAVSPAAQAPVSRVGQPVVPVDGKVDVHAFLPDDCLVIVPMLGVDTVSDLRFKLRGMMLEKYKARKEISIDALKIVTEGGWELNTSDAIQDVIREGKVVYCNMRR